MRPPRRSRRSTSPLGGDLSCGASGGWSASPAVRALAGVVLEIDAEDSFEVAAADDQEVVEAFGPDSADEPLGVGVRLGGANGGVHDPDAFAAEHLVERSRELAVAIVDQEAHPFEHAGEAEVARLLHDPRSGRVRRATGEVDAPTAELDEEEDVESTWRDCLDGEKAQASMLAACWRRNTGQLGSPRH